MSVMLLRSDTTLRPCTTVGHRLQTRLCPSISVRLIATHITCKRVSIKFSAVTMQAISHFASSFGTRPDHFRFDGGGGGLITRSKEGMRCFLLRPTLYAAGEELLMGECATGLALVVLLEAALVSVDGCFSGDGVGISVALVLEGMLLSSAGVSMDSLTDALPSCGSTESSFASSLFFEPSLSGTVAADLGGRPLPRFFGGSSGAVGVDSSAST
jgi:hypothetical protein